jgi:predicted dinucleotide-binding enzyme
MVDPSRVPGEHDVFLSGNDEAAKTTVRELLGTFGWRPDGIVDLGDLTTARGPELYVVLWLRLFVLFGDSQFNIKVVR